MTRIRIYIWKQECNFFSFSKEDYACNNGWTHKDVNVVVADNRLCTPGNERRRVFKEMIARKTKRYRGLIFQWSPRGNPCLPTSRKKQRCDALIRKPTRRKGARFTRSRAACPTWTGRHAISSRVRSHEGVPENIPASTEAGDRSCSRHVVCHSFAGTSK